MGEHTQDTQENARQAVRTRALEIFPSGYMTVVSIVQGVALAALAQSVYNTLTKDSPRGADLILVWAEATTTWLTVAVVFYMYVWFTIVARWAPDWSDTFVPIALGTAEVGMAAMVGSIEGWFIATSVTGLLGSLAFMNSLLRTHRENMTDTGFDLTTALLRKLSLSMLALGVLTGGVALHARLIPVPLGAAVCAFVSLSIIGTVALSEAQLRKILKDSGAHSSKWNWANLRGRVFDRQ